MARRTHFVTAAIEAALTRAKGAADGRDVRIGGGIDWRALGFRCTERIGTPVAVQVVLTKR